jgi:competence protein ComEA
VLNRDFIENFIKYHKKTIIKVFAGFVFFAAAFFVFCIRDNSQNKDSFKLTDSVTDIKNEVITENVATTKGSSSEQKNEDPAEKEAESEIFVDVGGAVKSPYVYELPSGSRVYEAIEMAGGLTGSADTSTLNLAQVLLDQDKLTIPTKEEVKSGPIEASVVNKQSVGVTNAVENTNGTNDTSDRGLININTATSVELQSITGIGPTTAEKIISYRQEQGSFEKIEDIMKVSGIGEKTFAKFKTKIMV